MLVFIDECLPASFRGVFEERGHDVRGVGDGFPSSSPDESILAAANAMGAVVVTTDNDWKVLIRQVNGKERTRFGNAGRVLFNCPHHVALLRLRELIDDIEREYEIAQRKGTRLIMRITGGNFRVER